MSEELESLLVSGQETDRKLVAEILSPYLKIDKDTCQIRPLEAWDGLKTYGKILLYLLARKAMKALDLPLEEEGGSAGEVMEETGLKKGTVNPALRKLLGDRLLGQTDDRRYFVPNHAVQKVRAMIGKNE